MNGDNKIQPIDALLIVNALNRGRGAPEPKFELRLPATAMFGFELEGAIDAIARDAQENDLRSVRS